MWSCTTSRPSFSSCGGASLSTGTTIKAVKRKMGLKLLSRLCKLGPVRTAGGQFVPAVAGCRLSSSEAMTAP